MPPQQDKKRIVSLGELLSSGPDAGEKQGDSDEEKPSTYYSGSGRETGMLVEGAPAGERNAEVLARAPNSVRQLLEKAMEQSRERAAEPASRFVGSSSTISGSRVNAAQAAPVSRRFLILYRNGFTVSTTAEGSDGRFHDYSEESSSKLLQQITSGFAPVGLFEVQPGDSLQIEVIYKETADYAPPKAVAAPVVKEAAAQQPVTNRSLSMPQLHQQQPTTQLQIFLNNQRIRLTVSTSATIRAVVQFLCDELKISGSKMSLFTAQGAALTADDQTIESLRLQRSVLYFR